MKKLIIPAIIFFIVFKIFKFTPKLVTGKVKSINEFIVKIFTLPFKNRCFNFIFKVELSNLVFKPINKIISDKNNNIIPAKNIGSITTKPSSYKSPEPNKSASILIKLINITNHPIIDEDM